jgi:hypothetical protein
MSVELPLLPTEIKPNNLVEIYRLFCQAYDVDMSQRDESFMRDEGVEHLRSIFGLDYRPYMGGKFFGQKIGNSTQFHGYSEPQDPKQDMKTSKFEKLVIESFSEKFE